MTLESRELRTERHTTHYLESGPVDGPLMVLVHGWPSTALIWRQQLEAFAAQGWHCIAPDLRGFGGSAVPHDSSAYAIEEVVGDLIELHDVLGGEPAVWVGHDWGSIAVGALAAHEPGRARGVVLVSWAYFPDGNSLDVLVPLVDRAIYPADEYPDGQWDYSRFYTTHFDKAVADLEADVAATIATVYRSGDPAAVGQVSPMAVVTRDGGRFGGAGRAPSVDPDPALWPPDDQDAVVRAFEAAGFRGACSLYVNDDANTDYARRAPDGGRLSMPVLFVNGAWDTICSIAGNRQGDPMRAACADLTVEELDSGHWLPLERPAELTALMESWLSGR